MIFIIGNIILCTYVSIATNNTCKLQVAGDKAKHVQ